MNPEQAAELERQIRQDFERSRALGPQLRAQCRAYGARVAARTPPPSPALLERLRHWLNPPDLVERLVVYDRVVAEFGDLIDEDTEADP